MDDVIAKEHVVLMHFTLKNADGVVLDSSGEGAPMAYLHGAGNLVPGLEQALDGKRVGDKLEVVVPPADGFGERHERPFQIPRDQFPPDAQLDPGVDFVMEDDEGNHHPLWVVIADDEKVTVDPNHPLAGVELHFAIEIVSMRAASAEELDHGHPHGPGGHH